MLTSLLDGWFKLSPGEGAFYAVFGFIFVFVGIVALILIFTLLGFVMKKINARPVKVKKAETPPRSEEVVLPAEAEEETDEETVAIITAAIAAYYEGENVKCDFVVRRIRKV